MFRRVYFLFFGLLHSIKNSVCIANHLFLHSIVLRTKLLPRSVTGIATTTSVLSLTPLFIEADPNETTVRLDELTYLLTTIFVTVLGNQAHFQSCIIMSAHTLHWQPFSASFTRTTRIWPHTHQYGQMDSFPSRSPTTCNGPTQLLMKIFLVRLDPLPEHYPTPHGLKASPCRGIGATLLTPIEGLPTECYGTAVLAGGWKFWFIGCVKISLASASKFFTLFIHWYSSESLTTVAIDRA
jgi:hypothetical protein